MTKLHDWRDEFNLSEEDEEFLDQLTEQSKKVCYTCGDEVDVDYGQSETFCPNCETITLAVTPK